MDRQQGRRVGGRYQLQERIGRGGLGVVYRAADDRLGRTVAVKLLNDQVADDPAAIQRLENEARTTAGLASQHVVQVYDFGTDEGRPYLVMEYLPGGTLAEQVAGRLPLPDAQIVDYGRQIAAGLAAAHEYGLIHRDVTPRNVLVGNDGRLKVTDFGIAKLAGGPSLTQTGLTMGTAISMAPEQARGQTVTPATDVYGLGVILYELATGRPPFTGGSDVEVALQHVQTLPRPPIELNPALPDWLNDVILRALAKEPSARYADGAAIGAALAAGPTAATPLPAAIAAGSLAGGTTTVMTELPNRPAELPATMPIQVMEAPGGLPPHPTTVLPVAGERPAGGAVVAERSPTTAREVPRRRLPLLLLALLPLLLISGLVMAARARGSDATPAATATVAPTRPPATATVAPPPTHPVVPTTPPNPTATPEPPPTATALPAAPPPAEKGDDKKEDERKKPPRRGGAIDLDNTAFTGGFSNPDGSLYADVTGAQRTATWIYGGRSDYPAMSARFRLDAPARGDDKDEARLIISGMDGEDRGKMPLRISLNDTVVFQGDDPLPNNRWGQATFKVPKGALRAGENTLTIRSLSEQGNFNSPHFFMLDAARLEWDA